VEGWRAVQGLRVVGGVEDGSRGRWRAAEEDGGGGARGLKGS